MSVHLFRHADNQDVIRKPNDICDHKCHYPNSLEENASLRSIEVENGLQ